MDMLITLLKDMHPLLLTLIATSFNFFTTALGAAVIFLRKEFSRKSLDIMLGFSGGIMIAVCYFSLIKPSLLMSSGIITPSWLPVVSGILVGGLFLKLVDSIMPHLHLYFSSREIEGLKTKWNKSILLVLAIAIHNIPEGLIVGVAFGSLAAHNHVTTLAGALALTIGIAIQNFPEGLTVSFPLRKMGLSRLKSFWYGVLSGVMEPLGGLIGALLVIQVQSLLPYALGFSAGAMMYVVVEQVIPETQRAGNTDSATLSFLIGFVVMLILEVSL